MALHQAERRRPGGRPRALERRSCRWRKAKSEAWPSSAQPRAASKAARARRKSAMAPCSAREEVGEPGGVGRATRRRAGDGRSARRRSCGDGLTAIPSPPETRQEGSLAHVREPGLRLRARSAAGLRASAQALREGCSGASGASEPLRARVRVKRPRGTPHQDQASVCRPPAPTSPPSPAPSGSRTPPRAPSRRGRSGAARRRSGARSARPTPGGCRRARGRRAPPGRAGRAARPARPCRGRGSASACRGP